MNIGFVGLGVMGSRMAGHLLEKGFPLSVYNRTLEKTIPLKEKGATVADSLQDLVERCEVVFICVSRTEDVLEVIEKMLPFSKDNTLFVDHSTIEPSVAKTIQRRLAERGLRFIDCPLTGGEKGAIEGTLTIFCGGDEEDFAIAKPYMEAYGKKIRRVGPVGSGQLMKMANQIAVSLTVLSMAECLVFCEKSGLNLNDAIELIGSGAGASWSLSNYGPKVVAKDFSPGFSVRLQQKDLVYALRSAREIGVSLPGTALVHQLFAALENAGRGEDATPALYDVVKSLSGG